MMNRRKQEKNLSQSELQVIPLSNDTIYQANCFYGIAVMGRTVVVFCYKTPTVRYIITVKLTASINHKQRRPAPWAARRQRSTSPDHRSEVDEK